MTLLFSPPNIFELPISKDGDIFCAFVYKPMVVDEAGEPVLDGQGNRQFVVADYPAGATVTMAIDTDDPDTPISIEATIDGPLATVWGDFLIANTVKNKKLWRAVITYENGLDQVLCNGIVLRYDGKEPKP